MLLGSAYGRGMSFPPRVEPDSGLVEVADRVLVARRGPSDVVSTVVAGSSGVLLVDAGWSVPACEDLLAAVRRLGRGAPVGVVGTHAHPAHVAGNAALAPAVPVLLHDAAAAEVPEGAGHVRTLSSVTAVDLGDRVVEVIHPGRGHTAGDLVVRVPDADVLVVGDLVRGDGPPSYGPDCWPLEWPAALDLVLQLLGDAGLAVPGHGAPMGRGAVEEQRDGTATVAEAVRELAGRGVPEDRALAQGEADGSWPWPRQGLAEAVRRGYAQLPPSARRLPLA
jgi:glyoxylase-like metal-dependent hydrolase (beta-lactamase superfamily II)